MNKLMSLAGVTLVAPLVAALCVIITMAIVLGYIPL
jgi:hypothetical protein